MAQRKKRNGTRTYMGGYKNYNFQDHDPILDAVDRLWEVSGINGQPVDFKHVHEASGVTVQTLQNWRMRRTKRPQFATLQAAVRSVGGDLVLQSQGGTIIKIPRR